MPDFLSRPRKSRLNWREVQVVYLRELRGALRERAIVLNSILIPIFLYPLMLWLAMTGLTFVMGQTENYVSRVAVRHWPPLHPELKSRLQTNDRICFVEFTTRTNLERRLREGRLEAVLDFRAVPDREPRDPKQNHDSPGSAAEPTRAHGLADGPFPLNFEAHITYYQAKDRSVAARDRLEAEIARYRADWLKREAAERRIDPAAWQVFAAKTDNVASKKQMGSFVLGMITPIIFVTMVAIGCFYPAVDATAGERERNTWETLMSTAASRLSVITGKYLYVATLGGFAGVLNLLAIMITARPIFGPLFSKAGSTIEFALKPGAIPVAVLAAVLLALFVAAGMMLFAAFARTFKEGQAMITPFYMLVMLPAMFMQAPGLKFTLPLALVPIVNVTMMVRDAMSGVFQLAQIGITAAVSLALVALCVRLAAFVIQFEDFMAGSYNGSLLKFLRSRRQPVSSPPGGAAKHNS